MKTIEETLSQQELKVITDTMGNLTDREKKIIIVVSELIHARTMNIAKNVNENNEKLFKQITEYFEEEYLEKIEKMLDNKLLNK